ncbi:MAG TPA: magnesium transporter CorA family protein [Chthoniobacterales bacterium]|nr:magnesium transporter CorA family protein [Chthoniobacterales bacterium]
MITFYAPGQPSVRLTPAESCADLTRTAVWIDLLEPTHEEEAHLEAALGINIPTREEMQAIELSSRLYEEDGMVFMTATVLTKASTNVPTSSAVTFILTQDKLVTLRYEDPVPFNAFRTRREANLSRYQTPAQFLAGLVDAIVERIADILETVGGNLDGISLKVFEPNHSSDALPLKTRLTKSPRGRARKARQRDFVAILRQIGGASDLVSRARESLVGFARLVTFFREVRKDPSGTRESNAHWKTIAGDVSSLSDHASFLSGKINFLLDATLGMINNEQNAIIKIISVAAVVFLPPTLIAGLYGMNFEHMPELKWLHGYPFAIALMVISAVLPYAYFQRKGWL